MADYGTNGTNFQSNVNNVNSNTIALFSSEGNMLRFSFRNENLILTIIPKVIAEDGRARWPKDMGRTVMLRPQACAALYEMTNKVLLPHLPDADSKEAGSDYPGYVTVPTNRDNTVLCGFGYKGGRVTFNIFQNVGQDRKCSEVTTYICDVTPVICEYDPTTGKYTIGENQSQFAVILQTLAVTAAEMSGATAHAVKVNRYFDTNQIIAYLRGIATKMGATPSQYGNFGGLREDGSAMQIWGNNQMNTTGPSFTPMAGGTTGAVGTWSMGGAAGADVGHKVMPETNQISSLDSLMGDAISSGGSNDPLKDLPF